MKTGQLIEFAKSRAKTYVVTKWFFVADCMPLSVIDQH